MEDVKQQNKTGWRQLLITVDQVGRARCHGDGHPQLTFRRLTHPVVEDGGLELTVAFGNQPTLLPQR